MRSIIEGHELQIVKTRDEQGVEGLEAVNCVTCERHGMADGFSCAKIAKWNVNPNLAFPLTAAQVIGYDPRDV